MSRTTSEINLHDVMRAREGREWKTLLAPPALDEKLRLTAAALTRLTVRVRSEQLRTQISRFRDLATDVTLAADERGATIRMVDLVMHFDLLNALIGNAMRQLDEDEDLLAAKPQSMLA